MIVAAALLSVATEVVLTPERLLQASPTAQVTALGVSDDGKWLASASNDGVLRIHSLPDGLAGWAVPAPSPQSYGQATAVAFSRDGKQIFLSIWNELRFFEAANGRLMRTIVNENSQKPPLLCADGKRYAKDGQLFDLATGKEIGQPVQLDLLSRDCTLYAAVQYRGAAKRQPDGLVKMDHDYVVREMASGRELWRQDFSDGYATPAAFSPDGALLVFSDGQMFDGRSGRLLGKTERPQTGAPVFSSDAVAIIGRQYQGVLARRSDGSKIAEVTGVHDAFHSLAFSPDGQTLYGGQGNGDVYAFRASDGQALGAVGPAGYVKAGAVSPDGRFGVAYTEGQNAAVVYDYGSGRALKKLDFPSKLFGVAAFSPDGSRFAIGFDETIKVYGVPGFAPQRDLAFSQPASLSFSADGSRLFVTPYTYGSAVLFNVENGEQVKKLDPQGTKSGALAPDARYGAVSSEHVVQVWNLQTGAMARDLEGLDADVDAIALSPDGATLAGIDNSGAVGFWDFKTAELLKTVASGVVADRARLYWSGDGRLLLIVGYKAAVIDVAKGEVVARAEPSGFGACGGFGPGARTFAAGNLHGLAVYRLTPEPPPAAAEAPKPSRKTAKRH